MLEWLSAFGLGLLVGIIIASLVLQARKAQALAEAVSGSRAEIAGLVERLRQKEQEVQNLLNREQQALQEKRELLDEATRELSNAFKALSTEALRNNNQSFLELAGAAMGKFQAQASGDLVLRQKELENLVLPVHEMLGKYQDQIQFIEKARSADYGSLSEQLRLLLDSEQKLQKETANLVNALRTPAIRGRWGEFTLRRVVELAGMTEHCDFTEQEPLQGEDGKLRPDMIVRLPAGKTLVLDSKVPLKAYLEALDSTDESSRQARLQAHARQVRSHLQNLSSKAYWDQMATAPEFVIMFIPGDCFYSAAIEQDPALFEEGVAQRVIIATPISLIPLMLTIAHGWRQERLAGNAQKISELGKSLYHRLLTLTDYFNEVGSALGRAVQAFNQAVGSMESRVLVAARRFNELGSVSKEEKMELSSVNQLPRTLQPADMLESSERDVGEDKPR